MKDLISRFRGLVSRKNTHSMSVVRMQAVGVLGIYLEHIFSSPATLTQLDIAVTPVEKDAAGVHCDAMIEAFFYCKCMKVRYGREGGPVPIPPKVVVKIRFRADNEDVLCWETQDVQGEFENIDTPDNRRGRFMLIINVYQKIDEFDRLFKAFRPYGRPILGGNHDKVVWTIDGPGR